MRSLLIKIELKRDRLPKTFACDIRLNLPIPVLIDWLIADSDMATNVYLFSQPLLAIKQCGSLS